MDNQQCLIVLLTVKKRYIQGVTIMRNRISLESASRKTIVLQNVMEDQGKFKLDLEYANVIVLKIWMMFVMNSVE